MQNVVYMNAIGGRYDSFTFNHRCIGSLEIGNRTADHFCLVNARISAFIA